MWVLGVLLEVVPIPFIQTSGVLRYDFIRSYAMLVDVVWVSEIHDRCEIVK